MYKVQSLHPRRVEVQLHKQQMINLHETPGMADLVEQTKNYQLS